MKLDAGDRLINVMACTEANDVLLATRAGKAIRFHVGEVRVFRGRDSMGVRGIRLAEGDEVVAMSVLNHVTYQEVAGGESNERDVYLKQAALLRRALDEAGDDSGEVEAPEVILSEARFAELGALEEFILTITEKGMGKRSSSHEYRRTGRGGQGIANIDISARGGPVVTTFPVTDSDQIMMVTDGGQVIRTGVDEIRIAGRRTQGVWVFRVEDDERVVSVSPIAEEDDGENGEHGGDDVGGADAEDAGAAGGDVGDDDTGDGTPAG